MKKKKKKVSPSKYLVEYYTEQNKTFFYNTYAFDYSEVYHLAK